MTSTALVKYTPPVTVAPFALPDLTISDDALEAAIHREHAAIMAHVRATIAHAYRAGVLLIEVKHRVGHSNYGDWIRDHCPFGQRTAQRYTRLVQHWPFIMANATALSDLTFERAMYLLSIPDRDEFATNSPLPEPHPSAVIRRGEGRAAREFTESIIEAWAAVGRRYARECQQLIRGAHGLLGHYIDPNEVTRRRVLLMTARARREMDKLRAAFDRLDADVKALPPHDPNAVLRSFFPSDDAVSDVAATDDTQQHETPAARHTTGDTKA